MLSLSDQIHNFLAEWQANQDISQRAGVSQGRCDFCDRERYVQYTIDVDASFCSSHCRSRYLRILDRGRTYA